jgi:hypothetical protein
MESRGRGRSPQRRWTLNGLYKWLWLMGISKYFLNMWDQDGTPALSLKIIIYWSITILIFI